MAEHKGTHLTFQVFHMLNDSNALTMADKHSNLHSNVESELSDYTPQKNVKEELKKLRDEIGVINDRVNQLEKGLISMAGYQSPVDSPTIETTNLLIGPVSKREEQTEPNSDDVTQPDAVRRDLELVRDCDASEKSNLNESAINEFFGSNYSSRRPENKSGSEVDSLKRQLEEKLRNAEVEMSIQRARVFQQKAELEAMKHQLDLREQAIQQTMSSQEKHDANSSRWARQFDRYRKK